MSWEREVEDIKEKRKLALEQGGTAGVVARQREVAAQQGENARECCVGGLRLVQQTCDIQEQLRAAVLDQLCRV